MYKEEFGWPRVKYVSSDNSTAVGPTLPREDSCCNYVVALWFVAILLHIARNCVSYIVGVTGWPTSS